MDIKKYAVGIYRDKQAVSMQLHHRTTVDYMAVLGYNVVLTAIEAGLLAILAGFEVFMWAFIMMYVSRLSSIFVPVLADIVTVRICKANINFTEVINIQPYLWSLSTLVLCVVLITGGSIYLLPFVTVVGIFIKARYYSDMGEANFHKLLVVSAIMVSIFSLVLR